MPITIEQALASIEAARGGKRISAQETTGNRDVNKLFTKERISASGGEAGQDYGYQPAPNIQPTTPESVYTNMPNVDKLTPFEHFLYKKLPGFSENTVVKALSKFGETWAGKLLNNILDIGAEGVERTLGFAAQYESVAGTDREKEFWEHIGEAWNAGTLAYDVTNLPTFKRDEKGKIIGITVPTDLPGVAGLTEARLKLAQGIPIEQVKDEYYNSLGALQLRAQLYDTYGHIVLDPINVIAGALKPVEKAHVLRNIIATTKYTDEGISALRDTINIAEKAGDIEKLAETARMAVKASDVASLQKISSLEKAGDVAGLAKLAGEITEANKLTRFDKVVIAITGGNPYQFTAKEMKRQWWNPFSLTPASRAHEYLSMVTDNVGNYIISKLDDPEDIVSSIGRAAKSATGAEFGHAFLTMEGRVTQASLVGFDIKAQELLTAWRNTSEARAVLQNVAEAVLGRVDEAALDTVINTIAKGGGEMEAFARIANITPDELAALGKILENVPYHSSLFKAALMNELYDHAAQMGIQLFGVKSRGLIEKLSLAMKSAESLAFLRTNPAFLVRNLLNNEITMIARGIFSRIGADDVNNMLQKIGYIPAIFEPGRLRQGFSMIGEAEKSAEAFAKGTGKINKVLRGKSGWLDNITNTLSDIKLGKLDMGELAQRVEVSARTRATMYGYTECYRNMIWKPGKGYSKVYDVISKSAREQIENIRGKGFIDALENKIASAWHEKELDEILSAENLNINIRSVIDSATNSVGFDIEKSLPADFIPLIESGLEEAMKGGRNAIDEYISRIRLQLQQRLDDLNEIEIERIATEMAAAIQVEGPKSIPKFAARMIDEFWEAHIAHAVRMEDLTIIGDQALRNSAWKSLRMESDNYFARVYGRLEAGIKGIKKGAEASSAEIPDGILNNFKEWQKITRNYFKKKSNEWDNYFDAIISGKTPSKTYEQITKELDEGYIKLIADEDAFLKNIDKTISDMIADETLKDIFVKSRASIAEARRLDKEAVAEFFKEIRNLSPAQREMAFKEFWINRQQRWSAINRMEQKASAAMAGDTEELKWANTLKTQMTEAGEEMGVAPELTPTENVANNVAKRTQNYMPDSESMGIFSIPVGTIEDQYYIHRGFQSLEAIKKSAIEIAEKTPINATDLPEDVYKELEKYIKLVKGNIADARYVSLRYGEWKADSALLNYNRRYNFDTWIGTIMPFEFWYTHSAFNWALHSLDRPAMLSTYLRLRKSLETMGAPNQKIPDRLKGHIRVNLPFAPKWMGNFFIDPIRAVMPFDQFLYPLEKWRTNQYTVEGQAERLLLSKLQNGEGDAAELQNALDTHEGETWELAIKEVEVNNQDLKFDAWDFVSLMSSPHAPLVWAKEYLEGTPENIGPFTPITRMSRGIFTMLGIEDFALAPHNIEAKVRKSIGLPAYDKWDEYRTARMLANMVYEGEISVFDMVDAMNRKEGSVYTKAVDRMNKEFAVGAVGGILGIPIKAYPIGELGQRTLYDELQKAYTAYNKGDVEALNRFFDKYPQYEARILQYKEPEIMARDFIIDKLWETYYSYSNLNRKEIREQLGDEFQYAFIDKNTRSYDSIDLNTLAVWLRLMGGNPPGTLGNKPMKKLELTPPEIAWRVDVFNKTRDEYFPDIYNIQQKYYALKEGSARKKYLQQHPELAQYWNWRRDYMMKNPDTIQYLTDLTKEGEAEKWQYKSPEAMQEAYENQPNLTWDEWRLQLGTNLSNLVLDNIINGHPLSETVKQRLENTAEQMGLNYSRLIEMLKNSLTQE